MEYKQHVEELLKTNKERLYNMNKSKTAMSLVDILEDKLTNFSFDSDENFGYLLDVFDILGNIMKKEKDLRNQFYDRFASIHNIIASQLHTFRDDEDDPKLLWQYAMLKKIIFKMENTMLALYYNNPAEYDPSKEEFIYYIVFELKNINIFNNACIKFPHIVNSVNNDGIPLIEKVLDEYLNALKVYLSKENLGPLDDLIYYDKVMRLILKSEKVKISAEVKKFMLAKIKDFYKNAFYTSNRHKEKLSFFINDILNAIDGVPENKTIRYLNYKYEIHNVFKEAHNLEATMIAKTHNKIGDPTTMRKIYTFDGEGAKEIDDGLSIIYEDGIYHLGIHIADPGSYICPSSILMDEAIRRTTSIYMGSDCIPLFPSILSSNVMSLNVGKTTYCMSYYFDIDERTGEMLNFEIKNERCRIAGNLTYAKFDEILDQGSQDKDLFETILNLSNVSDILKGILNEDDIYREVHSSSDKTLSTSVVENAMIYANYNVARLFSERDLPFIYRCHGMNEEDIKRLALLQERLRSDAHNDKMVKDIEVLKNIFPKAYYTRINKGHYGLGIDYYSHVTSPLRRLADNIANMCIKKFILGTYTKDDIERMSALIDEVSEAINSKRNSIDDYEIQYMHIKELKKQ